MASGFVHAMLDLMAFGQDHFDLHRDQDASWAELGVEHRLVHHPWYNAFRLDWDFRDPFPDTLKAVVENIADKRGDAEAETAMADVAHDYTDRVWDSLGEPERGYIIGFCVWVLFNPDVLREIFGVDVASESIEREIGGKRTWEHVPGLAKDYQRLYNYARVLLKRNGELASHLAHYG